MGTGICQVCQHGKHGDCKECATQHRCERANTCCCSISALEPDDECPIHSGGEWPPRCATCGRLMPWPKIDYSQSDRPVCLQSSSQCHPVTGTPDAVPSIEALADDAIKLMEKIARCEVPSSNEFAMRMCNWAGEFLVKWNIGFAPSGEVKP
jgi:hypothetical protein